MRGKLCLIAIVITESYMGLLVKTKDYAIALTANCWDRAMTIFFSYCRCIKIGLRMAAKTFTGNRLPNLDKQINNEKDI